MSKNEVVNIAAIYFLMLRAFINMYLKGAGWWLLFIIKLSCQDWTKSNFLKLFSIHIRVVICQKTCFYRLIYSQIFGAVYGK